MEMEQEQSVGFVDWNCLYGETEFSDEMSFACPVGDEVKLRSLTYELNQGLQLLVLGELFCKDGDGVDREVVIATDDPQVGGAELSLALCTNLDALDVL